MVQQEPSTPAARTSSERKGENLDPVSPTDPSPFPSSTSATQDTSSFPSLSVRGLAVLDGDVENGYASDDELLYALPKWPMLSASLQTTGENGADEQARRHSRSLESKGKGKQRSNGLPTPKKTPEEEAGWNDDEDHDARTDSNPSSGGKRKREEMEDAGVSVGIRRNLCRLLDADDIAKRSTTPFSKCLHPSPTYPLEYLPTALLSAASLGSHSSSSVSASSQLRLMNCTRSSRDKQCSSRNRVKRSNISGTLLQG